jgi:hypothetical protein
MTEEGINSFSAPGMPKPVRYNELVTLHALRADLVAPGATRVPCLTTFNAVVSWRPWLKMDGRPGHLMAEGAGRYGATFADMPKAWLDGVAARKPDVLADPGHPLIGLI